LQNFLENRILLKYSDTDDNATVFDPELENFDIPKKQKQIKNKNKKIKRQRKGLAINNTKIEIRIPGYKGIQLTKILNKRKLDSLAYSCGMKVFAYIPIKDALKSQSCYT
jgi:hypothetical protein